MSASGRRTPAARGGRRAFFAGVACAVLALAVLRWAINESTFPDRLVAPLLVEDTGGRGDAIVVLGAGVVGECGVNLNGVRRVLLGVRMWRDGRAPILVFTGDSDVPGCPVADAMARLAREIGVPDAVVHVETASRTTRENAELSAPLLRRLGARRLVLVTDRLHMRRAAGTFAQVGFGLERASVPIYEGHVDNVSMLFTAMRELVAINYYRMRGWIDSGGTLRAAEAGSAGPAVAVTPMQVSYPTGPIVVLGASYAGGWPLDAVAGHAVINRGVAGQQSFEMLARFETGVAAARPRAVILWGFINDIFRAPADVDAALRRTRESFTQMIALARRSGIEPIVATEVTIRPPSSWSETIGSWIGALRGKESYSDRINRHVIATNRWLVDLAAREGLLVLDLQSRLSQEGGRRRAEFTQDDGSHIAPAGYAALTAYAAPILERHLTSNR